MLTFSAPLPYVRAQRAPIGGVSSFGNIGAAHTVGQVGTATRTNLVHSVNLNESDSMKTLRELFAAAPVANVLPGTDAGYLPARQAVAAAPLTAHTLMVAKLTAAAVKQDNGTLYGMFASMAADGFGPDAIRLIGNDVREAVKREYRMLAGFPAVKVKGSKESGAPDYSTASAYAGHVANWLAAARDNPDTLNKAKQAVDAGRETPLPYRDDGFPVALSACAKIMEAYKGLRADAERAALGATLGTAAAPDAAPDAAQLERDNAALRARVADLLAAGTPGDSYQRAMGERDAARNERDALAARIAQLQSELSELRAVAELSAPSLLTTQDD